MQEAIVALQNLCKMQEAIVALQNGRETRRATLCKECQILTVDIHCGSCNQCEDCVVHCTMCDTCMNVCHRCELCPKDAEHCQSCDLCTASGDGDVRLCSRCRTCDGCNDHCDQCQACFLDGFPESFEQARVLRQPDQEFGASRFILLCEDCRPDNTVSPHADRNTTDRLPK